MSEWHTRSFVYADKMDLGNTAQGMRGKLFAHDVLLKDDFGVKPIVVDEGQWIHILLKSPQDKTQRDHTSIMDILATQTKEKRSRARNLTTSKLRTLISTEITLTAQLLWSMVKSRISFIIKSDFGFG